MQFEKMLNFYTIAVVVVLVLTTLVCTSVVVISKFSRNLGLELRAGTQTESKMYTSSLESCTQK